MNVITVLEAPGLINKKSSQKKTKRDIFAPIFEVMKKELSVNHKAKKISESVKNVELLVSHSIPAFSPEKKPSLPITNLPSNKFHRFTDNPPKGNNNGLQHTQENVSQNPPPHKEKPEPTKPSIDILPQQIFREKPPIISYIKLNGEKKPVNIKQHPTDMIPPSFLKREGVPFTGEPTSEKIPASPKENTISKGLIYTSPVGNLPLQKPPLSKDRSLIKNSYHLEGNSKNINSFSFPATSTLKQEYHRGLFINENKKPKTTTIISLQNRTFHSPKNEKPSVLLLGMSHSTGKTSSMSVANLISHKLPQPKNRYESLPNPIKIPGKTQIKMEQTEKRVNLHQKIGDNQIIFQQEPTIFFYSKKETINTEKTTPKIRKKSLEKQPFLSGGLSKEPDYQYMPNWKIGAKKEEQQIQREIQKVKKAKKEIPIRFEQGIPTNPNTKNRSAERIDQNTLEDWKTKFNNPTVSQPYRAIFLKSAHEGKIPYPNTQISDPASPLSAGGNRMEKIYSTKKTTHPSSDSLKNGHPSPVKEEVKTISDMIKKVIEYEGIPIPSVSEEKQDIKSIKTDITGEFHRDESTPLVSSSHQTGNSHTRQDNSGTEDFYHTSDYREEPSENRQDNNFQRNLTLNLKLEGLLLRARYNGMKLDLSLMFKDVGNIQIHQLSGELSQIIQESGIENYLLRIRDREREYRAFSEGKKATHQVSNKEINVRA